MDDIPLTIHDVFCCKHLKLCACQNTIAANVRSIRRIASVFVLIALIQFELHHDGLIGHCQFGGFIRPNRSLQHRFLKVVTGRCAMLTNQVLAFAKRLRYGDAVFICHHRCRQTFAILIVVVDIKLHARNRIAVQPVRFDKPDPAFGGFVFNCHFIGVHVLRYVYID